MKENSKGGFTIKVGFTGSRYGMQEIQEEKLIELLKEKGLDEFHHGDCIGSDKIAHEAIRKHFSNAKIFVHPPKQKRNRAFCIGDYKAPEKEYIVRNHEIVDASDVVIATPKHKTELQRSGTWKTIRYAKKVNKDLYIIYPSGKIENIHNGNSE
jgi:hypothetical protein